MRQKIKCFFGFHEPKSTGTREWISPGRYINYLYCKFCNKKYKDERQS